VKRLAAIVFSLLLLVTQTFAVALPAGSLVPMDGPDCCCDNCQCCVQESAPPAAPLAQASVLGAAQNQFILLPSAVVVFVLAAPAVESVPASTFAECRAAALPIFQRNCVFLI
jgi:hypothetical protein